MKFHTVCTVTNGVLPVEANVGQKVEWNCSLVDLNTGEVHKEFSASGVIESFVFLEAAGIGNPPWKYVIFSPALIDGRETVEAGIPVGFFR
jgi:hypothetical protein